MHSILQSEGAQRMYTVVFDTGDPVVQGLTDFAVAQKLGPAWFSAIGGFQEVALGFFNVTTGGFDPIPFPHHQAEVLSLDGDITPQGGGYNIHGHAVLGCPDGTARGGHLLSAVCRPTLIVTVEELSHARPVHH